MKHEADGIYYITREMLERHRACFSALIAFDTVTRNKPRVPITLENLHHYETHVGPRTIFDLNWLATKMHYVELVLLWPEYRDFAHKTWGSDSAKQFMDMLARRAKREGRLK